MSKKSGIKEALRLKYPNVFVEHDNTPTVVAEDTMMKLHFQQDKTNIWLPSDFFFYVIKEMEYHLTTKNCKVYILVFDKRDYVPDMKGLIHKSREKKSKYEPFNIEGINLEKEYSIQDGKLLKDWNRFMATRPLKIFAIRYIAEKLTGLHVDTTGSKDIPYEHLPEGKIIIIDGHCLKGYDPTIPIIIENINGNIRVYTEEKYKNKIGKADQCNPFYAEEFINEKFLGISKDTDLISYFLSSYSRTKRNKKKRKYESDDLLLDLVIKKQKEAETKKIAKPLLQRKTEIEKNVYETKDYFNPHICYENLMNELLNGENKTMMDYPIESFLFAVASNENDYIEGFNGIGHKFVLNAFFKYAEDFEDLIKIKDGFVVFDPKAYTIFVKAVYYEKYGKNINDGMLECKLSELRKVVKKKAKIPKSEEDKESYWVPLKDKIVQKGLRLQFFLMLLELGGQKDAIDKLPSTYLCGVESDDKNKPLSKTNIKKK